MQRADKSPTAAEERARASDFDGSVKGPEESTQHIGRASRSAGNYIPGG